MKPVSPLATMVFEVIKSSDKPMTAREVWAAAPKGVSLQAINAAIEELETAFAVTFEVGHRGSRRYNINTAEDQAILLAQKALTDAIVLEIRRFSAGAGLVFQVGSDDVQLGSGAALSVALALSGGGETAAKLARLDADLRTARDAKFGYDGGKIG